MKSKQSQNSNPTEGKVGCLGTIILIIAVVILASFFMYLGEKPI